MAKWTKVDWDRLNTPREEEIQGVTVSVFFSPYDMPEKVRGYYSQDRKKFIIEFRYLGGQEPLKHESTEDNIVLGIGKTTERLHEIEIDVDSAGVSEVQLRLGPDELEKRVENAIRRYDLARTQPPTNSNFSAVTEAIGQERDSIFEELVSQ